MKIEVNGEFRDIEEGGTVRDLVRMLGYDLRGMAVALDGEVVSRSEWDATHLVEGQRVEIVRAVQGG
jgi:sulfur carrier protein